MTKAPVIRHRATVKHAPTIITLTLHTLHKCHPHHSQRFELVDHERVDLSDIEKPVLAAAVDAAAIFQQHNPAIAAFSLAAKYCVEFIPNAIAGVALESKKHSFHYSLLPYSYFGTVRPRTDTEIKAYGEPTLPNCVVLADGSSKLLYDDRRVYDLKTRKLIHHERNSHSYD